MSWSRRHLARRQNVWVSLPCPDYMNNPVLLPVCLPKAPCPLWELSFLSHVSKFHILYKTLQNHENNWITLSLLSCYIPHGVMSAILSVASWLSSHLAWSWSFVLHILWDWASGQMQFPWVTRTLLWNHQLPLIMPGNREQSQPSCNKVWLA